MILKLVVTTNVNGDVFELILRDSKYGIGRRHDNDLRIKETYVSGYHSEINRTADGDYQLKDLGSSNGTFLNGRRIEAPESIKAGDFIKFGILKVAVKEHGEDSGPKIVSLKDRPVFAKKRDDLTSSIAAQISSADTGAAEPVSSKANSAEFEKEIAYLKKKLTEEESEKGALSKKLKKAETDEQALQKRIEVLNSESAKKETTPSKAIEALKSDTKANDALTQKLKNLEVDLSKAHQESNSLRTQISELDSKATQSTVDLQSSSEETTTLRNDLKKLKSQISQVQSSSKDHSDQIEAELKEKNSRIEALDGELISLNKTLEDKDSNLKSSAASVAELLVVSATLKTLKKDLTQANSRVEKSDSSNEKLEANLREKTVELESRTKELGSLHHSLAEKDGDISALAKQADELSQLKVELEKSRSELIAEKTKSERGSAKLADTINTLQGSNKELTTDLAATTSKLASADKESNAKLKTAEQTSTKTAKAAAALETKITDQKEKIAALQSESKERKVLEAAELADAAKRFSQVESENQKLKDEQIHLKQLEAKASEKANQTGRLLETVQSEKSSLEERLVEQTTSTESIKSEADRLQADLKKSLKDAAQNSSTNEKNLAAEIATLGATLAAEQTFGSKTKSEADKLKAEIEILRKDLELADEKSGRLSIQNNEISRNNGRVQAELNRESSEASQLREELGSAQSKAADLRTQIDSLQQNLSARELELVEQNQEHARTESDTLIELKRQLGELESSKKTSESKAATFEKENQSLSLSFGHLKEQFETAEKSIREASDRESELHHVQTELSRRAEKAEDSNGELAARIKEDAVAAVATKELITKLERQLQENESEALKREHAIIAELQQEISKQTRQIQEQEKQYEKLGTTLDKGNQARKSAEDTILHLKETIVASESELASMRSLLDSGEKKKAELSSQLVDQSGLAADRALTIAQIREELASTISRFQTSENNLLEKHRKELDQIHTELRTEKDSKQSLHIAFNNTRQGLSEALQSARSNAEHEKTTLLADSNAQLTEAEEELARSINLYRGIEQSRNKLEDELNERDEHIESLVERIEDLEIDLKDETEVQTSIHSQLQTTKEGLSNALHANRIHLTKAQGAFQQETENRLSVESSLTKTKEDLASLKAISEESQAKFEVEIDSWEERYNQLREEKLTLASEDSNLKHIREQINEAESKKGEFENELGDLKKNISDFQNQHRELKHQKEELLSSREKLKAELNMSRSELDSLQSRFSSTQNKEEKTSKTITSAEKRIQSLKKLEVEMEQAIKRKRQSGVLSRSEIFSVDKLPAETNGYFSEEEFYRKLISKLDLVDDLMKRYENKWRYPRVAEQLSILKCSFLDLLQDHSVKEFNLEPGTLLSIEERKRIKLVPSKESITKRPSKNGSSNNGHNSEVIETLRPGYVYENGSRNIIIRKAEVVVA